MSKLRFLFLEDNSIDAQLIIDELRDFGFQFEQLLVNNKQEFLVGLNNFNPHIVFSDFLIPDFNGIEVIKEIINKHQGIPIIIVSASINEVTAVECMKLGASDYILKNNLTRLGIATKSALEIAKLKEENLKVQNEIKAREASLSAIFKAADNVSFILSTVVGEDSIILEFSHGAENIFGYKKNEIIGKPVKILHTVETIENFSNYLNKMKKGEEGFKGQTVMIRKSGKKFPALHTAYPVFDKDGNLVHALGVTIDISKVIEIENALKEREAQLLHSQKMEAIGLMASGIAHNFNNILQVVVGYIDFAKEGLKETEQRYKDIEQINQHIIRATKLTKSLLAVGKEQFMTKNDIDINDIMKPIVDITNRTTNNNIEVKFTPQENLPTIVADGGQIDQVIMNIFLNAKDAIPNGCLIEASTQCVLIDEVFCLNNAWAKVGKYILIRIVDTGHGMDPDTKSRVFEPYFTTKDIYKSTGLGLSTAFGIISQHNGLFNVISEKNKGTTFEVYLPLKHKS
jgi:PAS domain S-box-containing protein